MGERRDIKFGVWVDHSNYQPTDDNCSCKGPGHITRPILNF